MDLTDAVVNGGVLIAHQTHDGKHQYQVENVVKMHKATWKNTFVRKGDKLMQINGMDLENLTPEEVAQSLAEGNPMLTVHKPGKKKEQPCQGQDTLRPFSKETITLRFNWEMTREEEEDDNGEAGQETKGEEGEEAKEACEDGGDLLIIEMTKTSISVVSGRSCDPTSPCRGCDGIGCAFNDIVLVSETSKVKLVPRGGGSFKREKLYNAFVEHVLSHRYIRGVPSQKTIYASPNPERITIYRYKSNCSDTLVGVPVVLNLTGSSCFLRCCKSDSKVELEVEICDKESLKQISITNEEALSYVFYMKGDHSGHRTFESALHNGWFIHVVDTDTVDMKGADTNIEERMFIVIIQK
ncbi:unnamed protein product [Ophioblennius macclurei]